MSASHAVVLTETAPFARAFVHVGMVGLGGEKMSKSQGNLVFVSALREQGVESAAIRLLLLAQPYQHDWDYTPDLLATAQERLAAWRRACERRAGAAATELLESVRSALSRDLDTPAAVAAVDSWAARSLEVADDPTAPGQARDVVDALLGVRL